jgi:hypothetical protein
MNWCRRLKPTRDCRVSSRIRRREEEEEEEEEAANIFC